MGLKAPQATSLATLGDYQFDLYNGARIAIFNQKCKPTNFPDQSLSMPARCANIFFDINGLSKPNTYGRDIFGLVLSSTGDVFPFYGKEFSKYMSGAEWESSVYLWKNDGGNGRNCSLTSASSGYACLARIMENVGSLIIKIVNLSYLKIVKIFLLC